MKSKILFGTNNKDKLREIRELVGDHLQILSLADIALNMDVEETEPDLEGNARLKAEAFAEAANLPCFADDTGLEVVALDGAPGVITARYAGPNCSPDDNIDKLLLELTGTENRSAQFRTVIAYHDGTQTKYFEGAVQGEILTQRTGIGGFGYDPVFQPTGYVQSFAEMSPEAKNQISHRGRAVQKFVEYILQQSTS